MSNTTQYIPNTGNWQGAIALSGKLETKNRLALGLAGWWIYPFIVCSILPRFCQQQSGVPLSSAPQGRPAQHPGYPE